MPNTSTNSLLSNYTNSRALWLPPEGLIQAQIDRREAPDSLTQLLRECQSDPVRYAYEVLGIAYIWDQMKEVARSVLKPPYKVLVKSGHKIGKSFLAAWLINWWFDCFNPSVVISTAPSGENVRDVLWGQVRLLRMRAIKPIPDCFIGPSAPVMRTADDHFAKGLTTNKPTAFHGRHFPRTLFVIDEAGGVEPWVWTIIKTMFKPELGHAELAILNPCDTSCQAFIEDQATEPDGRPVWRTFSLSSIDHPNIAAERKGEPQPIPSAISLDMIHGWVRDWCEPVADYEQAGDFEWKCADGLMRWYRPYADWESRCLGRWPSQAVSAVWSDSLWGRITKPILTPFAGNLATLPELGCDVAREGDDRTEIHTRWDRESLAHESHQGWKTTETTGRLIELVCGLAERVTALRKATGRSYPECDPKEIQIKVDDDGVGGGVSDRLMEQGYRVVMVRSGSTPMNPARYESKRSELWFRTVSMAAVGLVNLGRIDSHTLAVLRIQAMSPTWQLDSAGRRVVEQKKLTKKRLKRSPDGLDSMNLAYYTMDLADPEVLPSQRTSLDPEPRDRDYGKPRRGIFGR